VYGGVGGRTAERDRHASSRRELAHIERGPWAQWGRDKKPITQNALARLLRPHNVVPVDVRPEHARRKGYKRAQFEHLFKLASDLPLDAQRPTEQPRRGQCR
jgi:hypothetical protein